MERETYQQGALSTFNRLTMSTMFTMITLWPEDWSSTSLSTFHTSWDAKGAAPLIVASAGGLGEPFLAQRNSDARPAGEADRIGQASC